MRETLEKKILEFQYPTVSLQFCLAYQYFEDELKA
jgi:hypothetical protein